MPERLPTAPVGADLRGVLGAATAPCALLEAGGRSWTASRACSCASSYASASRAARALAGDSRTNCAMISSSAAPGWNTRATPAREQRALFIVGHDAADDHRDIAEPGGAQRRPSASARSGGRSRASETPITSTSSSIASFTTARDLLPRRRVDHLHAGVAQVGGDDAAAAVVAVEADLGDENAGGRG